MKWQNALDLLGDQPLLESSMLLAGADSPQEIRRQLSRWTRSGRLIQLRRGLYMPATPWLRRTPHPFTIAARIEPLSYVSLQSAMEFHGLIPESVPAVTSVTTRRPGRVDTPAGSFTYRHIHRSLFWGYEETRARAGDASSYLALPEKSLLDLIHLTPGAQRAVFLQELRLDWNLIDPGRLQEMALRSQRPKLIRAAALAVKLLDNGDMK